MTQMTATYLQKSGACPGRIMHLQYEPRQNVKSCCNMGKTGAVFFAQRGDVLVLLVRDCAGGVCFFQDKVFLLQNEKEEWVLPKGRIRDAAPASEVAIERLKVEGNVDADIILSAGETSYEFYSQTRKTPVYNKICSYIMKTDSDAFHLDPALQFKDGGFFPVYEGMEMATYSQDKGLISYAYRKYLTLMND